jgi:hypothetical protein
VVSIGDDVCPTRLPPEVDGNTEDHQLLGESRTRRRALRALPDPLLGVFGRTWSWFSQSTIFPSIAKTTRSAVPRPSTEDLVLTGTHGPKSSKAHPFLSTAAVRERLGDVPRRHPTGAAGPCKVLAIFDGPTIAAGAVSDGSAFVYSLTRLVTVPCPGNGLPRAFTDARALREPLRRRWAPTRAAQAM